jgi:hypothetical protein
MTFDVINLISSRQATATVNEWLVCYVGDRFLAGEPDLDHGAELWRVPILYVYPQEGPIGTAGEVTVDAITGEMRTRPTVDEIKSQALNLYQSRHGSENSPLSSSGN